MASLTREEIEDLLAASVGIESIVANTKGRMSVVSSQFLVPSPEVARVAQAKATKYTMTLLMSTKL